MNPVKTLPINDRHHELYAMSAIQTQMPVMVGTFCFEEFYPACKQCEASIEPEQFRGQITKPFDNVAILEAVGICPKCRLLTEFFCRFHPDGEISFPSDTGGWRRAGPKGMVGEIRKQLGWSHVITENPDA